jgi:hypothetical protein
MRLARIRIERYGQRIRPGGSRALRVPADWLPGSG